MPSFGALERKDKSVAIVGAGPAGLGAAIVLAREGYAVTLFDQRKAPGGMCHLIPAARLPKDVIKADIDFLFSIGGMALKPGVKVDDPRDLLKQGFDAVAVCTGLDTPLVLGIDNEDLAVPGLVYLERPRDYPMTGSVAIVGGGATALDCATTAAARGAARVELIALENFKEMPLTPAERQALIDYNIEISGRTRVTGILVEGGKVAGVRTINVALAPQKQFNLDDISDIPGSECTRREFDHVVIAIGAKSSLGRVENPAVFYGGDLVNGPTSVVEAVASGKNVAAMILCFLTQAKAPEIEDPLRSTYRVRGRSP
jgi:NADPH-dependent glutamate synthase beta subunit-like oxidoreductase